MKHIFTVTVGIPAYNEQSNIQALLEDLLRQDCANFRLEKIIVNSDGSTDQTTQIVQGFKNTKIKLMDNKNRKGVAHRLNQIIELTKSDILVLLNADIRIPDTLFLDKLISPIVLGEAELTSSAIVGSEQNSFIESVLNVGMNVKTILFETWRHGQNGYMCHGTSRAFSRRLYSMFKFTDSEGEDMYSYLFCIANKLRFKYVKNAFINYHNPRTIKDHFKQSIRYFKSQQNFSKAFSPEIIKSELNIPIGTYFAGLIGSLKIIAKHPVQAASYLVVVCAMKILSLFKANPSSLWNATSTKG